MSSNPDPEKQAPQWYVYIIRASDERLYTGVTTDVERRFNEHCSPLKGARFFRGRQPLEVVYTETHPDRSSAQRRESAIKGLSRDLKLELIGQSEIKPPGRPC